MTHKDIDVSFYRSASLPGVRNITLADLKQALALGIDDFRAKPSHLIFLGVIYPLIGLVVARLAISFGDALPLLYPLVAGFALMGPVTGIGLYELSRRREQGLDITWKHAFDVVKSPSIGAIAALSGILLGIFVAWVVVAELIFLMTFGQGVPASLDQFIDWALTTNEGWTLIIAGNGVGLVFAITVLTISAVSFPLLLDRQVGVMTAVWTSARVVFANIGTMAVWGLIIAIALAIGSLPFFIGLAIVVPVLAHATWHLYRRAVEP